jgi:hypothetical protein
MSLTNTTLAAACGAADLTLRLTSVTGAVVGAPLKIENEYVGAVLSIVSPFVTVRDRGAEGTLAVAHNALAPVNLAAAASDFIAIPAGSTNQVPPFRERVQYYSVNGAIALPDQNTTVILNKAGVAAMTLADPTRDMEGLEMTIMAGTAQANTVTYTTGFNGGGAATDVGTFGGAIGDNFRIKAVLGVWNVMYLRNVTLA